jgi:hypothetical protein
MLDKFWLKFGETQKIGMTNLGAYVGFVVSVLGVMTNRHLLPAVTADWLEVGTAISIGLIGLAGGRSSDLKGKQGD